MCKFVKDYIDIDTYSVIVFDDLVNYPGFDGDKGELKAFYEFITKKLIMNRIDWNKRDTYRYD